MMMKRENGSWIFTLVFRLMVNDTLFYVERFFMCFLKTNIYSILKNELLFYFCFTGKLSGCWLGKIVGEKKTKEGLIRYLVIIDIFSECSGWCDLFNLKRIPTSFGSWSCNSKKKYKKITSHQRNNTQ